MATPTNPIEQLTFDMATGSTPVTYDITTKYFAGQEIEIPDQYVRITDLETGLYKLTYNGAKYIYFSGSSSTSTHTVCGSTTYGVRSVFLFVRKGTISGVARWNWWYIGDNGNYPIIYYGYSNTSGGSASSKSISSLLTGITSHSSSATTYGVGTTTNYGHCKMVTGDVSSVTSATNGVVAASYHNHDTKYASKQHQHDDLVIDDGVLSDNKINYYFAIDSDRLIGQISLQGSYSDLATALSAEGYTSVDNAVPVTNALYRGSSMQDITIHTASGFIYMNYDGDEGFDYWPNGSVTSFMQLV